MHLNIEIKARCQDPERIRSILESEKADFKGVDHQIDTYFVVPNGRLKLREGRIENNLIHYQRGDQSGPKASHVSLFNTEKDSPLKGILADALGIKVIVDKLRAIYFIKNVKFHIDQVKELGNFVEIEAIDHHGDIGEANLLVQCQSFMKLLGIREEDLLETSYSDMLIEKQQL